MDDAVEKGRTPSGKRNGATTHPEAILRGDEHPMHLHPELRAKGSSHGNSKLTEDIVANIRSVFAGGEFTQEEIAKSLGITQGLVSQIVLRKIWTHV